MTTASNWLLNWAIAYSTPFLVNPGKGNADLQAKIFFLWGGCCLVCAFFVWGMIYETKGLSLEEVDEMYEKVDHAWKSNSYVPSGVFKVEGDRHVAALASGEKLKDDIPIVDHSSEQTEVTGGADHTDGNGVAKETPV
jgi:SP family sugar:H+ symporter-like MFS transporter